MDKPKSRTRKGELERIKHFEILTQQMEKLSQDSKTLRENIDRYVKAYDGTLNDTVKYSFKSLTKDVIKATEDIQFRMLDRIPQLAAEHQSPFQQ